MTGTSNAFGLTVPPTWLELDVRPATRDAAVAELVRRRVAEVPELRDQRTDLTRYLRNLAARAWDAGARYCAVFTEPAGDGIIPGAITVTHLPPAPGSSHGDEIDAIVDQLQQAPPTAGAETWRTVSTTDLPHVGSVVQTYGVQDVELNEQGYQLRSVSLTTYVPVDDGVLVVMATSPAVDLAEPLLELFAAVTATLTLHELADDEDPT